MSGNVLEMNKKLNKKIKNNKLKNNKYKVNIKKIMTILKKIRMVKLKL